MSDSFTPSLPPDAGRRKLVAIAAAVVVVSVMAFAFMSGGKKPEKTKDTETDTPVGVLQDGPDLLAGGEPLPDDWFLNAPNGGVTAPETGTPTVAAADAKKTSSVVTGDNPAANPLPGTEGSAPSTTTATTGTVAVAKGTTEAKDSSNSQPHDPSTPTTNGATGSIAATNPSSPNKATATTGTTDSTAKSNPNTSTGSAGKVASNSTPTAGGLPQAITTGNTERPSTTKAGGASVSSEKPVASNPKSEDLPEFVRPAAKRTGLIAQTRALVTERQFRPAAKPDAEKSTAVGPSTNAAPAPVVVAKPDAEEYARRTTETLRQQGTLKPTQSVRLPRQQETVNTRVWREEDVPATPEERRPFGLVVEDTHPAFTPEGIPLRTDVPAGASPLEKTGADKPLWKKPE